MKVHKFADETGEFLQANTQDTDLKTQTKVKVVEEEHDSNPQAMQGS